MAVRRRLDLKEHGRVQQRNPATYLYAARALRDFGDGFVAVLLPVYLTAIGLGVVEVGVVATAALLGSALMTIGIGLVGARVIDRPFLIGDSALVVDWVMKLWV